MKPKVIIYKKIPHTVLAYIKEHCHVSYYENLDNWLNPQFLKDLSDAQGLIGSSMSINKELLDKAPQLKIVCNASVGYNNFDMDELTRRGIMATNTPDVLTDTTADTIFGLLLSASRRICEMDRFVKDGKWEKLIGEDLFGTDVHHKVLGIIGMGRIGSAIAKRASLGFDMEILYHNRSRNENAEKRYGAKRAELKELLSKSDFVCLMTPLTDETKNLISYPEFKLMKKTAFFINGSRGETVNEEALVKALYTKKIAGAGLDVYSEEPINPDHPLLKLKNAVTLPHMGSATAETRTKMALLAAENLVKGVSGETPPSLLNKSLISVK
ncbi:D-glycerate dehydrogenase [Bacillus sp. ISL-47]|uniref:2-hydroxyacid dehydrogenase n=1 Tax=Bacillus sp. ISL-47 TaxID=2819130 RepID=UPI001BEBDCFE|nr:D-glycerate dehydrogenase [Bacillus sp. ISL-47]MBT2689795.1 D-glycerate dehydrogenase [Bacillus sp. ISL-47]MBT2709243.1 D-glycerate dehydrogenase [Pseudomonas sp. ISL-84]